MCRYFNGIYKYLRAAKEGREKLHSHLVQPDSLGIALLGVASSGQLCTQVSTALPVLPPSHCMPLKHNVNLPHKQAAVGEPPVQRSCATCTTLIRY